MPEADLLEMAPHDLKLCYPWLVTAEEAIELAKRTEAAAFAVDKCITNSEGASVHAQQAHFVAANSRGFMWGAEFLATPSRLHLLQVETQKCKGMIGTHRNAMPKNWQNQKP